MLDTFIKIGEKLREDKSTVQFLPFVKFGEKYAKTNAKGKITQERPFVQVYDVFIEGGDWRIVKSDEPYDENTNVTFIKGDNNDRFYIAGDINANYLGGKKDLNEYFSLNKGKAIQEKINELDPFILKFRETLELYINQIQKEIDNHYQSKKHQHYFVQFKFHKDNTILYWSDLFNEVDSIVNLMITQKYTENINNLKVLGKQPVSFLSYQNLNAFQNLKQELSYKNFDLRQGIDMLKDLLVANKYIFSKSSYIGKSQVNILPAGEYSRESLLSFLSKKAYQRDAKKFKDDNKKEKSSDDIDILMEAFEKEESIRKFDVLFLNKGGQTTDVVAYISSINKTDIESVKDAWKDARAKTKRFYDNEIFPHVHSKKINEINNNLIQRITPFNALNSLLKGFGGNDPKLESHTRLVLYKLLRNQYHQDPQLLIGLIRKTEYGIRNNDNFRAQFLNLFINYLYLNYILIKNQFIMIQETKSYQIGILLGELARNLDQEINSFSKQYAGNISRRIATKEDFQSLLNFIQEKLVMHEKLYTNVRNSATKLNELLADFEEQYKKDYAVAGFFYSYMMPFQKKKEKEG